MKLSSNAFFNDSPFPAKYTSDGDGINPPLEFDGIPQSTKSLAIIMEDPDAISNPPYVHWVLFNISANLLFIKEGVEPGNAQKGLNSSGESGYFPAAPPPGTGTHHYIFRLFALDEMLADMPEFTDKDMLLEAMHGHVIEQTELMATYEK